MSGILNNKYSNVKRVEHFLFMSSKKAPRPAYSDARLMALERRMGEVGISRRELGRRLDLGETTPQKWFEEDRWPEREESRLTKVVETPPNFFELIANGFNYEDALSGHSATEDLATYGDDARQGLDTVLHYLALFFGLRDLRAKEWEHIERQVIMLGELLERAYPELTEGKPLSVAAVRQMISSLERIGKEAQQRQQHQHDTKDE